MTSTRKRLAIVVTSAALFSGLGAGLGSAQAATVASTDPAGEWLCGSIWPIAGVCLDSPIRWADDIVDSAGSPPR